MTDRPDRPDPPERDPASTWDALERLAVEEDARELEAMAPEARDAELRAHGTDPARAALVGQDLLEKAAREAGIDLAKVTPHAPASPAAPKEPAPRPAATQRRAPLIMSFFAGALLLIVGVAVSTSHTAGNAPDNAFRAQALREEGLAACQAKAWADCLAKLDEASRFDNTIEDDAVRAARAEATRALGIRRPAPPTPHE